MSEFEVCFKMYGTATVNLAALHTWLWDDRHPPTQEET